MEEQLPARERKRQVPLTGNNQGRRSELPSISDVVYHLYHARICATCGARAFARIASFARDK